MKRIIISTIGIYILSMIFGSVILAQSVSGRVIDSENHPIAEVYVFVRELSMMVATNNNGEFEIQTDSIGTYSFTFNHSKYNPETRFIKIPSVDNTIQLNHRSIVIPTNTNTSSLSNGNYKDPAQEIMEKVISVAPLYRDNLFNYKSEAYIKGSMRVIQISSLLRSINQRDELNPIIREGDVYIQESVNDILYERNKYRQISKPISNTFPKDFDIKLPLANYNIYDTENLLISPLSQQAFNYYNFIYEGTFIEGDNTIDQIRVDPKKTTDKSLAGYLYISRSDWHVNRLELINISSGMKTSFRQIYTQLEDKVWVISKSDLDIEVSILGNRLEVNYVSEMTFKNYFVNNEAQKKLSEIDFSSLTISSGSIAYRNESEYWRIPKTILLTGTRIVSNQYVDNFQRIVGHTSISPRKRPLWLGLLIGNTFKVDSTLTIGYGGLTNPVYVGYNLVDGWSYKQTLDFTKRFKQNIIQSGITVQYSFNRKYWMFDFDTRYFYLPQVNGMLTLNAGMFNADFNNSTGINEFENRISSLLLRKNYINFYGNKHFNINQTLDLTERLTASIGVGYYSRTQLTNVSDFSVFYKKNRQFRDNIPLQNEKVKRSFFTKSGNLFSDYIASIMTLRLVYMPNNYYVKSSELLQTTSSNFPEIAFTWNKGLKNVFNSTSDFDHVEIAFRQNLQLDVSKSFQYTFFMGYFPNNSDVHFSDFKHFNVKELNFMLTSFDQSYNLLTIYQPSTNDWYISSFNRFSTDRFFLKQLPFLSKISMQENLFLSYLLTLDVKNYIEMGYSLSNIINFTNIGIFVGFENFVYRGFGVKVSFNIANTINML